MQTRTQTADLLKGIAVVFMIQVHLVELFATVETETSSIGRFLMFLGGPFVAPVFMCLFGYFIAQSKRDNASMFFRGVKVFLLGILLNLLLNFNLFVKISLGQLNLNITPYLFGVDILLFAGLTLITISFMRSVLKKNYLIPLVLSCVVAFLGTFLLRFKVYDEALNLIISFVYGSSKWSYFPLLPWLAYPLLGFSFYQVTQQFEFKSTVSSILLVLVSIMFLVLTISYAIDVSANLQQYYHHGLLFCSWTIIFMLLYSFWIHKLETTLGNYSILKYLKWLGKNVTLVYVIQWVLIGNIATEIYKTVNCYLVLFVCFIGVLILSSFLTYMYLKFKKNKQKINSVD